MQGNVISLMLNNLLSILVELVIKCSRHEFHIAELEKAK